MSDKKLQFQHICAENAVVEVVDDVMTITVDLKKSYGTSKSGKTVTVGSTGGFIYISSHPGVMLSMNVNKKPSTMPKL